ncbi:hypothetical protein SUGI_0574620 [Cryptomeria japonica]|nr:hypothetical protein SUGI_0574620 [Cryptomeria japonica]
MLGVLDMLYFSAEYIPSCTRNIPLMLRQLSLLFRRLFSCLLMTAEDMRDSYLRRSYLQHHVWAGDDGRSAHVLWNNVAAIGLVH